MKHNTLYVAKFLDCEICKIAGWGTSSTGEPTFGPKTGSLGVQEMLRSVNLPIRDINKCKKEWEIEDGSFLDTSICAGEESKNYNPNPISACQVRFKLKSFVN